MTGRRLFREFAQSQGKEAREFMKIIPQQYDLDILVTKDSQGGLEETVINYKTMIMWVLRNKL